jgi:hypothetical protein
MAGAGLQNIPLRIPDKWDAAWYARHIREVLALADTRNAIEGSGISITGQPGETATISTSEDLQNLLLQTFVLAAPSGFLEFERVLAGETGVIDITDGGAGGNITVSIADNGINLGKLAQLSGLGVLGNPVDDIGAVQNIQAELDGDVLTRQGTEIVFTNAPVWTGNHTWIDSIEARLGTGGDLRLYHDGTDSFVTNETGELWFETPGNFNYTSDTGTLSAILRAAAGQAAEFRWLRSAGVAVDWEMYIPAAATDLRLFNSADLFSWSTTAFRVLTDNVEIQLGAGIDLRLYHDGTDSYIRNDTGALRFNVGATTRARLMSTGELLVRRATSANAVFVLQVGDGSADLRGLFHSNNVYAIGVSNSAGGQYYVGASSAGAPDYVWSNHVGTERLRLTDDGRLYGTALHNNAGAVTGAVTGATNQYIASGTYTPTLTNSTNISSSTARVCQWLRVGNVVTVSGIFDATCTAAANTATALGMSLPIASALALNEQLGGAGSSGASARETLLIVADTTNDRATIGWAANSTSSEGRSFSFTYTVL